MSKSRFLLGSTPINLYPGETVSWELATGVAPVTRIFEMSTFRAEELLNRAQSQTAPQAQKTRERGALTGPLTLTIEDSKGGQKQFKQLFVVSTRPARDENSIGLLVTDRRWFWSYELVERQYNIIKRAADTRFLEQSDTPIAVAQNVSDLTYRLETLKDRATLWTPAQILEDVLKEIQGDGGFIIDSSKITYQELIQGLALSDSGERALARVLAFIPGVDVFIDENGQARLTNTLDQTEATALADIGAPARGAGTARTVNRSLVRPSKVNVYFDREIELRFNYKETETGTVERPQAGNEPLDLVNVIPVPDPTVTIGGRTVNRGTYVKFSDYISAIAGEAGAFKQAFNMAAIRKHFLNEFQLMYTQLVAPHAGNPDLVWARRLEAIRQHFRQTFQVTSRWRDKIRTLRAYRASIVDPETGVRGRAEVFADYIIKPTFKGLVKSDTDNADSAFEVRGYADNIDSATPSPVDVDVIDPDNLILRVTGRVDPSGIATNIIMGRFASGIPTTRAGLAAGVALALFQGEGIALSETFNMAIVLTAVQAVPNSENRLHRVEVTQDQARQALGLPIGRCSGPLFSIRIGGGVDTARFAWSDDQESAIRAVFNGDNAEAELPQSLLVNPDIIRSLANAAAAQLYATMPDRYEGNYQVSYVQDVVPTGSLRQIQWAVNDNAVVTAFVMPPLLDSPSLFSLLPESVRRIVQREVQL